MGKVVLVVCDGLGYLQAREWFGYLEGLVEARKATVWKGKAQLPSNSRPNYESLHTGLPPTEHGIVANELHGIGSMSPHVFGIASKAGLVTAAVAYHWVSELYNTGRQFDPMLDVECDDPSLPIQHGRFYFTDDHPDEHVFATAMRLTAVHQPDYLLVHPMGVDAVGHELGRPSDEFRLQVKKQDVLLSLAVPIWRASGYTVIVTADHGHDDLRQHGGTTDDERDIPIYLVDGSEGGLRNETVSNLSVAPTVLSHLGLDVPAGMSAPILSS